MIIDLKKLERILTNEVFELITKIGTLAEKNNIKAYLVGGLVRDLIRENLFDIDIDIILEGNAINFARKVADFFKGQIITHEKYGTAKVKLFDTKKTIDFATCRTEIYPFPASNPQVTFNTLEKDLFRRDFTINSIAMCINKHSFGELVDPFNGYNDIEQKKLKILHDLSFYDDPNRIFRAIRFCSKLNFEIEEKTKNLAIKTMNSGIFDFYINDRIKTELKILFTNKYNPVNNIKNLFELQSLRFFEPKINFDNIEDFLNKIFYNIEVFENELNIKVAQWIIYISLLLNQIKDEKNYFKLVELFRFEKTELKIITETKNIAFLYQTLNNDNLSPYEIYNILNKYETESIIYLLGAEKILLTHQQTINLELKEKIIHYLQKTKAITINITGADLIKLGVEKGKLIGVILEEVKKKKLMGRFLLFKMSWI